MIIHLSEMAVAIMVIIQLKKLVMAIEVAESQFHISFVCQRRNFHNVEISEH